MKTLKILLVIILIVAAYPVMAQSYYKTYDNSLSLTFHPQDNGIGLRYDKRINGYKINRLGYYCSFSYGNYEGYTISQQYYEINNHIEIAAGMTIRESNKSRTYLAFGINYHYYEKVIVPEEINENAFSPFSLEFGAGCMMGRFNLGYRYDLFKNEGNFEIGLNF